MRAQHSTGHTPQQYVLWLRNPGGEEFRRARGPSGPQTYPSRHRLPQESQVRAPALYDSCVTIILLQEGQHIWTGRS